MIKEQAEGKVRRFPNVYDALQHLRSSQKPSLQSEAQMATDILWGKRPGIEEKYDALLMKLDRSYSGLTDKRDHWKKIAEESPLARKRQFAKAKVAALNIAICDLQWMKARNRDLIDAITSPSAIPESSSTAPQSSESTS